MKLGLSSRHLAKSASAACALAKLSFCMSSSPSSFSAITSEGWVARKSRVSRSASALFFAFAASIAFCNSGCGTGTVWSVGTEACDPTSPSPGMACDVSVSFTRPPCLPLRRKSVDAVPKSGGLSINLSRPSHSLRAFGGTAENLRPGKGAYGQGLFAIDPEGEVRLRVPENLLMAAFDAALEERRASLVNQKNWRGDRSDPRAAIHA